MKPLNILIVEDDVLIADMLAEILGDMGHAICAIETTEAGAVAAAARNKPDLLIVDARLREGSGLHAINAILAAGPVPHVLVSGDIAQIRAHRPNSIALQKPYTEAQLVSAIERAVAAPLAT